MSPNMRRDFTPGQALTSLSIMADHCFISSEMRNNFGRLAIADLAFIDGSLVRHGEGAVPAGRRFFEEIFLATLPIHARWRHHYRGISWRPKKPRRCQKRADGPAISSCALFAEDKVQAHAAYFDHIAIIEAHRSLDRRAVHDGNLVARTDVKTVVALIDLCGHVRFEPTLEAHCSHCGFSDDGELARQHVFFLIGSAVQNDQCRHFKAARGKLRALTTGGGLLEHLAALFGV